jgi:exodeoxyribonuclease VII small subunit
MAKANDARPAPGFEESLKRLETIVHEMESGDLSLDQMMRHFEEGDKLAKFCNAKLNEVERKIEKLVKKDGGIATEPFETKESDDAEEP